MYCPLKITQHTAINVWTAGNNSDYTPKWKCPWDVCDAAVCVCVCARVCVCVRACVCVLVGSIQTERQQHVCSRLQSQQVSKHVNSMLNLGDYQRNVLMFWREVSHCVLLWCHCAGPWGWAGPEDVSTSNMLICLRWTHTHAHCSSYWSGSVHVINMTH